MTSHEQLHKNNHKSSVAQRLESVPLFRELSAEQLANIAERGQTEPTEANQILFAEGLPPDMVYIILSGRVKLYRRDDAENQLELAVLGKGELLGLTSAVDGEPRWATALTLEFCELFGFHRAEFFSILSDFPQLLTAVLASMAGKVRSDSGKFMLESKKLRLEMARERYRSVAQALAATNKAKTVEEAMQIIVDQICLQTGWPVGHAYIVGGESGEELVSSTAWHLGTPDHFEPFRKLSDATRLLPGIGLPGLVMATGTSLWIADLQEGLHFPRAGMARSLGLRAGFAFPVLWDERVVAVLEFFSDRHQEADELLLEAMTSIGTQLGRIIESKRYEEQLLHNALHDPLTDLPNRALFLETLKQSLARLKRHSDYLFAVLFIDLDRFKVVNDSLGHVIGDLLLVEIARRIQACLRPMDVVARLGGDEYAILLDDIKNVTDATRTVERIRTKLQLPLTLNGREIYTSASIGIALSSPGYDRPEHLLRDADTAMYRAKKEGKDLYKVFDVSMHEHAMKQLQLENDMRRAIDRREFRLHYQPIVSLETGRIVAFEALLRWLHPERGLLPPSEFIRLAEETELIIPLTHWVLQEACSDIKKWQTLVPRGSPLSVSVNLSSRHLAKPSVIEEVAGILARNELSPQSLTLEITESQLMENAEALSQILVRLSKLGFKIAIDDFGTGYSSLSYLSGFSVHALKIDRNFVCKLRDNAKNAAIVRAIVSLGRNLGLDVIAEGVETAKQLDYLRELKCLYGQGYYFFPPMEPEAAAASLTREVSQHSEKKVRISRLCSFDLFEGLTDEELAEIAQHSKEVPVSAGTVLMEQGQMSEHIYLMEQGSLGIHRTEAGISQFLGVLEAPAFLGEMSLLNPQRTWTARVKALSDLRLLTVPVSNCISYLQRSVSFRNNLEQLTAGRNSI